MSKVCLDTSAYSRLLRGDEGLRRRLETVEEILVPVTVLGELHAGFRMGTRLDENVAELGSFLEQPGVRVMPTTENVAERYGVLVKRLKDNGTPIPTNDVWIAASVLESGSRLVAYDAHFDDVPGLLIESP